MQKSNSAVNGRKHKDIVFGTPLPSSATLDSKLEEIYEAISWLTENVLNNNATHLKNISNLKNRLDKHVGTNKKPVSKKAKGSTKTTKAVKHAKLSNVVENVTALASGGFDDRVRAFVFRKMHVPNKQRGAFELDRSLLIPSLKTATNAVTDLKLGELFENYVDSFLVKGRFSSDKFWPYFRTANFSAIGRFFSNIHRSLSKAIVTKTI